MGILGGVNVNSFTKFFSSTFFRLFLLFVINVAIAFCCSFFGYIYIYFGACVVLAFFTIFFLAHRIEKDTYKVIVFLLMFFLPLLAIGCGVALKQRKGSKKIKKEWSDIIYRNRKSVFQSNETMENLKKISPEAFKTCSYLVDTVGMPCFQNANTKYYSFGEAYFNDMMIELEKAERFILLECYKIKPGKTWTQIFDILRLKARQGVHVKLVYDDAVCTKYIPSEDYQKMINHGIETVPFNKVQGLGSSFANYRNYKRICVIDGKVGFYGGFDIDDEYVVNLELISATKDCGLRLMGESVKNLTVMFFEDYQFATKKVINLQEYFADTPVGKTKDWVLPYSTNPVSLDHTNKNVLLSILNNAKEHISIVTSYIALDDELRNALVVNARSGVKVRLIFCGNQSKSKAKVLARSYFYDLIKDGIEVYEYKAGKMTTKLILIDNNSAFTSTSNLDSLSTYRHFNAGLYVYGDAIAVMHNDMREIISNSQLITIKDLQKRKIGEKIKSTWIKFLTIFK